MTGTTHAASCDWHLDQYPWECTCGALTDGEVMAALLCKPAPAPRAHAQFRREPTRLAPAPS